MAKGKKYKPVWAWYKPQECVVMVVSQGHFPDTFMVMLPDDRKVEVYANQLEEKPQ